jgi:PAS domain S-box-containing protein
VLTKLFSRSKFKFGSKSKAADTERQATAENLQNQKDEIVKQLEAVDKLNEELSVAVKETQDISNELIVKLDQELGLAKRQLDSVSKSLSDGLIFLDHVGRILHFNKAAESMLGICSDDVIGKSVITVFKPMNSDLAYAVSPEAVLGRCSRRIFQMLKDGQSIEGEGVANIAKLGKTSVIETWTTWGAYKFNLILNLLEPNPSKPSDVSYVCIFKPFGRRATD